MRCLLLLVFVLIFCGAASAKRGRTYYTAERLAVMRENVAQYDWAQAEAKAIIARADRWVGYDDERLRSLVPPPTVARAGAVNPDECPVHGQEVLKHGGRYAWGIDFDKPYQVKCPAGGEVYPSNDFVAYMKSGMQDRSLLTGEYADDGYGWRKAEGDRFKYWFVAFYAHWAAHNLLLPALSDLSRAYLLTEDSRYAHKTAVLLWQMAQYYPDYAYEKQSNYGLEVDPGYNGRLLYHTWECLTVDAAAPAYDAIYPGLAGDAELPKLTGQSPDQAARDIEERLLRVMARDITDGSHRIGGNYGMHQKSLLLVAAALADCPGEPDSAAMVDWVLNNSKPATLYTDSAFHDTLVNLIHRDGIPLESPSYNCGWMVNLAEMADLLLANGVNLWEDRRFRRIYEAPIEMLVGGWFTTPLGDSNHMFSGPLGTSTTYLQSAFAHMRSPRQAQAMLQAKAPFERRLFERPAEEEARRQAPEAGGEVGVTSSLLPGLGFMTLQTGPPGHRTGLSLYYGYYYGHIHFDALNVDFYAEGNPLTPDLGYPETADTYDPRRYGFLAHTVVHNTCMVDARRQELARGQMVAFHPGQFAQMAEVTNTACYAERVRDYRRTTFLVDADPQHAYYVDVFRVVGGKQHDWLVHGTEATFDSNLPLSEPRTEGTLAGPEVAYGHFYDDEAFKESRYGLYYYNYRGSAFQWLQNVQQAEVRRSAAETPWARWKLNRDPKLFPEYPQEGVALRLHLVPDDETVLVCDGTPVRRANFPDRLKWLVRRRSATEGDLTSDFVTVYEGYKDTPFIANVRRLPVTPAGEGVAVEVDLGPRKHIIFRGTDPGRTYRVGTRLTVRGRAAVVELDATGRVLRASLFDGTELTFGTTRLRGSGVREARIRSVDYQKGTVTLEAGILRPEDQGRWLPVTSDTHEATVRVEKVISPTRFSIADQDLRTARGQVLGLRDRTISSNAPAYYAGPGMTVVNERGQVISRLEEVKQLDFTLRSAVNESDLPDGDGDGRRRFTVMAVGPGDVAHLGSRADWKR